MTRYMLDTNAVAHLLKRHAAVLQHVLAVPMASLCISAITEGELRFGLAKRPQATRLHQAVDEFLLRVDALSWDSAAADTYSTVRAALESRGRGLAPLDVLIAAHALSTGCVLVTSDRAFAQVPGLALEDWTH